ncbi:hypothetical protein [Chitinasiproducens palmae]|uniref:Uncharacterized protein n=1 Tax=Chitinasiproducens palmae TaxID=1770053 RepID=A0A1H2PSR3_9BURK|nr:hypothetical protein [Chitinasiproducens palmae]SDV49210.1 hypothetical protein SAMN05216551_107154 [Chitinasiproducens palmae]
MRSDLLKIEDMTIIDAVCIVHTVNRLSMGDSGSAEQRVLVDQAEKLLVKRGLDWLSHHAVRERVNRASVELARAREELEQLSSSNGA